MYGEYPIDLFLFISEFSKQSGFDSINFPYRNPCTTIQNNNPLEFVDLFHHPGNAYIRAAGFLFVRDKVCECDLGQIVDILRNHLATAYEYSTTSGAERAYKKIVDKLTELLVNAGVLGVVELKLTEKNKKIAAAAYEYKAVHRYANDADEWGEIRFDFSAGTVQIVKLADGDLSRTHVFAKIAIRQILKLSMSELPKKLTIPFELEQEKIRYGG